jgi:rhamnogalacturonyl hydrolase YesR
MTADLPSSIKALTGWVERHDYKAYDPGDGSLSFLQAFTGNIHFFERLLTAAVLRVPFNIRPLLGIRPHTSTKGHGYMAWGYLRMFKITGDVRYRERCVACLDWLIQHKSAGYSQFCWGNHFSFSTRAGKIPKGEPTIVWSGLIGQAFMDAYEELRDPRYLEVVASVCEWILKLPRLKTERGHCLSYVAFKQSSIHNANMLGAALLGRWGAHARHGEALEVARDAMNYSCSRLEADGAWFYGEEPRYHWIDSFHTGYNLDSLKRYVDSTGNREFDSQLRHGYEYFKKTFFEADGRVRYYHDRIYPIDIQCLAQAIDTLSFFSPTDPQALDLAQKVATWTVEHMQDRNGHFYYRDLGWKKIRTPMYHWGQGTMFKALSHLLSRNKSNNGDRSLDK